MIIGNKTHKEVALSILDEIYDSVWVEIRRVTVPSVRVDTDIQLMISVSDSLREIHYAAR